jgi:nucleotide-binding universal stress UspA family protein
MLSFLSLQNLKFPINFSIFVILDLKQLSVMEAISLKKILVATDYTELSENAVTTASAICQKHDAILILLHVVKNAPAYTPPEEYNPTLDYTKEMKIAARSELRHLGDRIRNQYKIQVDEIVSYGEVVKEILRIIHENNPDLVLIGTHGASGFRRFFIGSTAYRVIKYTKFPVITIPGAGDWADFRNILFPIRLIPDALKKYDVIRPIIRKNSSTLHILGLTMESGIDKMNDVFELEEELEGRLQEDQVTFDVSYHRCNNYADKILETAEEKMADLIVIIATMDKTKGEFFIGPFSQQILNHAKVPVLCIRT